MYLRLAYLVVQPITLEYSDIWKFIFHKLV